MAEGSSLSLTDQPGLMLKMRTPVSIILPLLCVAIAATAQEIPDAASGTSEPLRRLIAKSELILRGTLTRQPFGEGNDDGPSVFFVYVSPEKVLKDRRAEKQLSDEEQILCYTSMAITNQSARLFPNKGDRCVLFLKHQDVHLATVDPWFMWLPYRPGLEAAIADEVAREVDNSSTLGKTTATDKLTPFSTDLPLDEGMIKAALERASHKTKE